MTTSEAVKSPTSGEVGEKGERLLGGEGSIDHKSESVGSSKNPVNEKVVVIRGSSDGVVYRYDVGRERERQRNLKANRRGKKGSSGG